MLRPDSGPDLAADTMPSEVLRLPGSYLPNDCPAMAYELGGAFLLLRDVIWRPLAFPFGAAAPAGQMATLGANRLHIDFYSSAERL
jgi:hypothetical protein